MRRSLRQDFDVRILRPDLWHDGKHVHAVAGSVATWPDRSGKGVLTDQGTSSRRPASQVRTGVNGRPAVVCDGVDDRLTTTLGGPSGSHTFVFVYDPARDSDSHLEYLFDTSSGRLITAHIRDIVGVGNIAFFDGAWKVDSQDTIADPQIVEFVLESGGNGEIVRNGVSLGTAAYTARAISGNRHFFSQNDGSANYYEGAAAEIIYWSRAVSVGDRRALRLALAEKYGIRTAA